MLLIREYSIALITTVYKRQCIVIDTILQNQSPQFCWIFRKLLLETDAGSTDASNKLKSNAFLVLCVLSFSDNPALEMPLLCRILMHLSLAQIVALSLCTKEP